MAVRTAYAGTASTGDVYTAANHAKMPGGWIGYVEVTAIQTGITTEADLTGLTVTVTVGASRRIKVTGRISVFRTVADGLSSLLLKEGATYLDAATDTLIINNGQPMNVMAVLTPSTGAHTYKLALQRDSGSGTLTMEASAARKAFLLVEDLGPAS
jgi:hypothetical protein